MRIFPKSNFTLMQLLGPSVVFVALSLNGGEMLLWPNLVSKYGLWILWPVPLILWFQYKTNLEIERYTITTGKNTLQGLIQMQRWLGIVFTIGIFISLAWPAWASVSGNILAFVLGFSQYGALISALYLLLLICIWFSPKSYKILETGAKIGLTFLLSIALITIAQTLLNQHYSFPSFSSANLFPKSQDNFLFLSALAYGGVAGVLNLVQSDWVTKRKYGINQESNLEISDIDWENPESKRNWKTWWRLISQEHFILFVLGNVVGIGLISLLAALTLNGAGASGFNLLTYQVQLLNQQTQYGGFMWAIGIFLLFSMAQITILDASGRLLKQTLKTKLSNEHLSQLFGLLGVLILLISAFNPNFNQPSSLLEISASISALIMALYPPLLLALNSKLPKPARPTFNHYVWILSCSLFYGAMVIWSLTV
jgi:hypothetical protein